MLSPETRTTQKDRSRRLSRPWRVPARFLRAFVDAVGDSITITAGYPMPDTRELPATLEHARKRGGKVFLPPAAPVRGPRTLRRAFSLLYRLAWTVVVLGLLGLTAVLALAVVPRAFGYSILVVNGGSMGEAIPNGSLVISHSVSAENVAVGDVILVRENVLAGEARPKVHRIASKQVDGAHILVRTKGDANNTIDPQEYILPDRVVTPKLIVPYAGRVSGFVTTPSGWVFFVLMPAVLAAAATLQGLWFPGKKPALAAAPVPRWGPE